MALFLDGPVPLDATTTFVQNVPWPSNLGFSNLFPRKEFDTDTVDFATLVKTNRVARFRNWDGAPWVSLRDTGQESRVKMLPLGGQLSQGEYERRQLQFAGAMGATSVQKKLADAVYNDLETLTYQTQNRLELAWGDVLSDGVLTIAENGVYQEVDFGVPNEHIVAPEVGWDDIENSTPLTDLVAWTDAYQATNGVKPGQVRTSLKIQRLLQRNQEIINAIRGAAAEVTRVNLSELNDLLASEGLPTIVDSSLYDSSFDVDGSTQRVIDDDKFLLLPSNISDLGFTAWGTPTTAFELQEKNVHLETAAGIIGVIIREDGTVFRKFAMVDAVAMPILADPKKLMIGTVLEGGS